MARSLSQAQRWWAHICCRNSIIKVLFKVIYLMLKWDQKPRGEPANWKDKTRHSWCHFSQNLKRRALFFPYFLEMRVGVNGQFLAWVAQATEFPGRQHSPACMWGSLCIINKKNLKYTWKRERVSVDNRHHSFYLLLIPACWNSSIKKYRIPSKTETPLSTPILLYLPSCFIFPPTLAVHCYWISWDCA